MRVLQSLATATCLAALCLVPAGVPGKAHAGPVPPSDSRRGEPGQKPSTGPGEETVPSVSPCAHPSRKDAKIFDRTTQMLADTMCNAALWLDGLIGGADYVAAGHTTDGRLELAGSYSEFYGDDYRVRVKARVRLPALNSRLSAFVGREDDDEIARDREEGFGVRSFFDALDDSLDWFAGLGYDFRLADNIHSDSRVGVRSLSNPQLFVQERVLVDLVSDEIHLVQLRTTPFWNTRDGFGFTGGFDASRALTEILVLRWASAGTVTEESIGVDWRSALILFHNLGRKRGLAYELFVRGLSGHPESIQEYGSALVYRQPFAKERLFAMFRVGYSWPRSDPDLPRNGAWGAALALEIPLGER